MTNYGQSEETYGDRRVLVTGATGFIGRSVARALGFAGAKLWLAGRDKAALRKLAETFEQEVEILVGDLSQPGAFLRVYQGARPDVTFHLAGYGVDPGERDAAMATALNTSLIAEAAEVIAADDSGDWPGIRLVHAGSAAEYGSVDGPVSEDSPGRPDSLYGKTKLEGTRKLLDIVKKSGLRAIVARLFTVYGPGEREGRLLPSLLALRESGEPLPLTAGEQRRDFTYVGDVAEGLFRLGRQRGEVPAVVNLATGKLTRVREFAECAAEVIGIPVEKLRFGALPYRTDELQQGPVDTSRLRGLVNWSPKTSIADGIRATINSLSTRSGVAAR